MSENNVVVDEEAERATTVEFAVALINLLEKAKFALPQLTPEFNLARPGRQILHKMLASKIVHGFQLEFVMPAESYFGFIIGLDEEVVQIYDTGFGQGHTENRSGANSYPLEAHEIFDPFPVRTWLPIRNIEAIKENFLGLKHLTKASQDKLNAERRSILKIAERYLKGN